MAWCSHPEIDDSGKALVSRPIFRNTYENKAKHKTQGQGKLQAFFLKKNTDDNYEYHFLILIHVSRID